MVLDLDKLRCFRDEENKLVDKMRYDVTFWLSSKGLFEVYYISNLNFMHLVLEGMDTPMSEDLIKDFEEEFGLVCESIHECKVMNRLKCENSFVRYSYYFCMSGGIY